MLDQALLQQTLQKELYRIRTRNPSYSLRAFAGKLGIAPSSLSEILNGKRKVSFEMAERLCDRLVTAPEERHRLLQRLDRPKASVARKTLQLASDAFHVVSDWHYFAILSLAETESFRPTAKHVAKRLGIPLPTARQSLERLERLGMLERRGGKLTPTSRSFATSDGVPDLSIRKNHAQALDLARQSLDRGDFERTDFIGTTLTFDPAQLPLAKKLIRRFRDELCAAMDPFPKKAVYRLNVQLIPLTDREAP